MAVWLTQNLSTIVISVLLLLLVGWIIRGMEKIKKQGGSSCGGSCGSCPMGGSCHKH